MSAPIRFSRHARRRMRLYRISEDVVCDILRRLDAPLGRQSVVQPMDGFALPVKIVTDVSDREVFVITAYPLKRSRQ